MILGINGIKNGCDFPMWMQYALVIYMISFIALFGNFYAKMYLSKGKAALNQRQIGQMDTKNMPKILMKQKIK